MKIIPIILSLILASSALGYGIHASALMAGSGGGTPCTASQPCAPICGNHLCAPGEVYASGMAGSNASTTKAVAQNTNSTGSTNMATQVSIGTNVTATKNANGTMTGTMTTGSMNSGSMSMTSQLPSPNAQVSAGAQPANVKCISGFYLVINNSNSRPACVTQNTMSLLEARGWGHAAP